MMPLWYQEPCGPCHAVGSWQGVPAGGRIKSIPPAMGEEEEGAAHRPWEEEWAGRCGGPRELAWGSPAQVLNQGRPLLLPAAPRPLGMTEFHELQGHPQRLCSATPVSFLGASSLSGVSVWQQARARSHRCGMGNWLGHPRGTRHLPALPSLGPFFLHSSSAVCRAMRQRLWRPWGLETLCVCSGYTAVPRHQCPVACPEWVSPGASPSQVFLRGTDTASAAISSLPAVSSPTGETAGLVFRCDCKPVDVSQVWGPRRAGAVVQW